MNYQGQMVTLLGLGQTGLSMARYLHARGANLRLADSRGQLANRDEIEALFPNAQVHLGPFTAALFEGVDLVAASPGVPLNNDLMRGLYCQGIPVVGDVELFARALPKGQKVIAITGANGKTTVTTLSGLLCQAAGLTTVVAGNIGPAVLDQLPQAGEAWPDVYVLELSSFQLDTTFSLRPSVATVLNISEDHLDRYSSLLAYAASKERLLAMSHQQVLNLDDAMVKSMAQIGTAPTYFSLKEASDWYERDGQLWHGEQHLCAANQLQLLGAHNRANVLASLALVQAINVPINEKVIEVVCQFKGLAHRVERIASIKGVAFIDDSKGTNVGATVAALEGLGQKSVLIAGGVGKEQDFSPLLPAVNAHCRAVCLIGAASAEISQALVTAKVPVLDCLTLENAVQEASVIAQNGDAVLLSPACASFDQFRDYLHRSEVFATAVAQLQERAQ